MWGEVMPSASAALSDKFDRLEMLLLATSHELRSVESKAVHGSPACHNFVPSLSVSVPKFGPGLLQFIRQPRLYHQALTGGLSTSASLTLFLHTIFFKAARLIPSLFLSPQLVFPQQVLFSSVYLFPWFDSITVISIRSSLLIPP